MLVLGSPRQKTQHGELQRALPPHLPLADAQRAEHHALDQLSDQHQDTAGRVHQHLHGNEAVSDGSPAPLREGGKAEIRAAIRAEPAFVRRAAPP